MAQFNATIVNNACIRANTGNTSVPVGCCDNPAGTTVSNGGYYGRASLTPASQGNTMVRRCRICVNSG
jgi:hypothetical protein